MAGFVALFRGINVGGRRKVAMDDVREVLRSLGHTDVETYLQSGNAVFTARRGDPATLAREIEEAVESRLGVDAKVLVRTPSELAALVDANPFPEAVAEPSKLHVAFLSETPAADRVASIEPARFAPDELRLGDRAVYLWYPNGAGRTKLTNDLLERRLGVTSTSRNWNTVVKLLERAAAAGGGGG